MDKREEIVELVEKNLPRFSGDKKVFVISFYISSRMIKMIFWRPRNYTLVAYNHGASIGEADVDGEQFTVTAHHDSCWRYDGFSFLNKSFPGDIKNLKIISTEVLDSQTCVLDSSEKYFFIWKKPAYPVF